MTTTAGHELTVRSYATNDETAGILLLCSCGWKADIRPPCPWDTNPRRYEIGGDDGQISLDALNELAAAHLARAGAAA
jgi:hypothetical protein